MSETELLYTACLFVLIGVFTLGSAFVMLARAVANRSEV